MSLKKLRLTFIIATTILILIVLGFTGGLNIASFQQNYTDSLISTYRVLAGETVKKIEYSLKYGKPLTNFYGIEELLEEKINDAPDIKEVVIALPNGNVLYNDKGAVTDKFLDSDLNKELNFKNNESYKSTIYKGDYHVFVPIKGMDNEWVGSLGIVFDQDVVKKNSEIYMKKLLLYLVLFALVSVTLLSLFVLKVSIVTDDGEIRKNRLLAVIFVVLGIVQVSYGSMNYMMLKTGYLEVVKENTSQVLSVIQEDVEYIVNKGVPYSKLYGVGDYMKNVIASIPEIDRVSIIDQDYTTTPTTEKLVMSEYTYTMPLAGDITGKNNFITMIDLSKSFIDSKMRNILLDTVTMLVVSFFLMVEISLFTFIYLKRKVITVHNKDSETDFSEDRTIIRPLSFVIFASVFMSTAFIPMLMKDIYQPIRGLSQEVVLGLPISAEMLFMAIASLLGGFINDKKGWKPTFLLGVIITALGTLLSAFALNQYVFIFSRAIVGAGFGFALIAMQAYVVTVKNEKEKNDALSALNSGALAGANTGVVLGGMLADRIGFHQVFIVSFIIVIVAIVFSLKFTKNIIIPKDTTVDSGVSNVLKMKNFLKDRNVFSFLIFILIPISIGGMFLVYFFPLYAEQMGISPSNTSRAFLLHGLCVIYLGPLLSSWSERLLGAKKSIVAGNIIVVIGLLIFALNADLVSAFVAIVLLGIAESFGITAQVNYFISQKSSMEIGEGQAMGYYSLVENFGQMIGPITFGSALIIGMSKGVGMIAVGLLITVVLFMLISKKEKKIVVNTEIGEGM